MNTEAFQNTPEPLTVVCGYDEVTRQITIYGVYGAKFSREDLRQQYSDKPHVRFIRQYKNMHQPHAVFAFREQKEEKIVSGS